MPFDFGRETEYIAKFKVYEFGKIMRIERFFEKEARTDVLEKLMSFVAQGESRSRDSKFFIRVSGNKSRHNFVLLDPEIYSISLPLQSKTRPS